LKISKRDTCLQTSSATAMISSWLGRVARPYLSPNFKTSSWTPMGRERVIRQALSSDELDVLKLGLRYGLATRPK
jgi:hypothetical protein